jgi:hypothetical protein
MEPDPSACSCGDAEHQRRSGPRGDARRSGPEADRHSGRDPALGKAPFHVKQRFGTVALRTRRPFHVEQRRSPRSTVQVCGARTGGGCSPHTEGPRARGPGGTVSRETCRAHELLGHAPFHVKQRPPHRGASTFREVPPAVGGHPAACGHHVRARGATFDVGHPRIPSIRRSTTPYPARRERRPHQPDAPPAAAADHRLPHVQRAPGAPERRSQGPLRPAWRRGIRRCPETEPVAPGPAPHGQACPVPRTSSSRPAPPRVRRRAAGRPR